MSALLLTLVHQKKIQSVLCEIPELKRPVYPHSHHHTEKMIIVIIDTKCSSFMKKQVLCFFRHKYSAQH
jgi:hypothetical protein